MSNPDSSSATPGRLGAVVRHVLAAIAALAVLTLAVGVHMAVPGMIVLALGHLAAVGVAFLVLRHRERVRAEGK